MTAQLGGWEAPLQVGDVPLQVDQRLALLLKVVVQGLARAAVPDHEVEDGLKGNIVSGEGGASVNDRSKVDTGM